MIPEKIYSFIMKMEGGKANDQDDPGGLTWKGITQGVFNEWRKARGLSKIPVTSATDVEVHQIYESNYWVPSKAKVLFGFGLENLSLAQMDCAVNMGVLRAIRLLQESVGAEPDGIWGPATETAVHHKGEHATILNYLEGRADYYHNLSRRRPPLRKFLKGWLARLRHVARETGVAVQPSFAIGAERDPYSFG